METTTKRTKKTPEVATKKEEPTKTTKVVKTTTTKVAKVAKVVKNAKVAKVVKTTTKVAKNAKVAKVVKASAPPPENICSICLEPIDYEVDEANLTIACGHDIHSECARGLCSFACPTCRDDIYDDLPEDIAEEIDFNISEFQEEIEEENDRLLMETLNRDGNRNYGGSQHFRNENEYDRISQLLIESMNRRLTSIHNPAGNPIKLKMTVYIGDNVIRPHHHEDVGHRRGGPHRH